MRGFAMKIYKYDANFLKKNKNKKNSEILPCAILERSLNHDILKCHIAIRSLFYKQHYSREATSLYYTQHYSRALF